MKKGAFLTVISLILFAVFLFGRADTSKFVSSNSEGNTESESSEKNENEGDYIRWVDFSVCSEALSDAVKLDIETKDSEIHITVPEALAYLSTKNYGVYDKYKSSYLKELQEKPKLLEKAKNKKLYNYYIKAYSAAIGSLVGNFSKITFGNNGEQTEEALYGVRLFSPIASGFYYTDYDDFGATRSYGYRRRHLGHDMLGSVGTPIVAVESGVVEACGWNQYGGWRIGIRSFDGKRYYYYAHLRKNHPFNDMYEGKIVNAGEVIGYLGMTGYSARENTNNIDTPHLHIGLELIFDKSQKDGNNQIWIDIYELTKFLSSYKSEVYFSEETKEYYSEIMYIYNETPD